MTHPNDDDFGRPPDSLTDEEVDAYAADVWALSRHESDSQFAPASPIDREDPYNAYVTPFTAESADHGPLSHLEMAVKDNLAVRGVSMTAGTDTIDFRPREDATVVDRLRQSGAVLTGTTNMDALAFGTTGEFSGHGRTDNPSAEGYAPGGSSSGSSAAVAGGLVDAALGSDTGGSVRIPASFCGIVGFKPTYGLVSRHGLASLAPSLDHVGVLASNVETATEVIETIAGRDIADPTTVQAPRSDEVDLTFSIESVLDSLRIGVVEEFMDAATDGVRSTVWRAVTDVETAYDCTIEGVSLPSYETTTLVNDAQTVMEFADVLSFDGHTLGTGSWYDESWCEALREFRDQGIPVDDRIRHLIHLGRQLLEEHEPSLYVRTWEARRRFSEQVREAFKCVDVLVTPTTPMVAPAFGEVGENIDVLDTLQNTAPFNNTGQPCLSVPCGHTDGRPVGLQLTTPAGTDAFTACIAQLFEEVTNGE
jgi:Asp-tRNA(Asn)/Glu-tRNA(Gln) amidotransferase A subunit family amidase